jgi:hypothetical protein
MKIESYKAVVATPQAHSEFLPHVVDLMERVEGSGQEAARQLYTSMRDSIDVGGNPFSQARHLHALEDASDSWDVEETPPEVLRELLSLSEQIQGFDPGYTVCDFTVGYHWIKELAGDAEIAPPR